MPFGQLAALNDDAPVLRIHYPEINLYGAWHRHLLSEGLYV